MAPGARSPDLFAWLRRHPEEWKRLAGRCVVFHLEHKIMCHGENMGQVVQYLTDKNIDAKESLLRHVPPFEDQP